MYYLLLGHTHQFLPVILPSPSAQDTAVSLYLEHMTLRPLSPQSVSSLYLGHMTLRPPSTQSVCPVMKEASSEARKAMGRATSSTSPGRPSACVVLQCSRNCHT